MLEAPGGFLAVFTGGTPDALSLARQLKPAPDVIGPAQIAPNGDYQIARYLAVKLVPGAHALHPAVEAAVNAARESGARPEDVAQILVAGPQSGLVAAAPPKDFIQAIHSLSYYIASAVADKDFSWVHAEPAMIERPVIGRLIGLVAQDPAPSPVRYQWSDIEAKYRALMPQSKLPADRISEILRTIRNFEQVKSVSELTGLLS